MRGAPMHPQTRGKMERWHQTLKNSILLENYSLLGDLEQKIAGFVSHYNHLRYRKIIANAIVAGEDVPTLKPAGQVCRGIDTAKLAKLFEAT